MSVIVVVAELGSIGPHESWNCLLPERSMVAASQYREVFLQAKVYFQTRDGQVWSVGHCLPQSGIHENSRMTVCQQPEKISLVADRHR